MVFQLSAGVNAVALYRSCWLLGAVAVPLHPRAGRTQLARVLEQVVPTCMVAEPGRPLAETPEAVDVESLTGEPPPSAIEVAPSEDALVMFTSGSTGVPKGVIHTHSGLVYKVKQLIDVHGLGPQDVVLMPAP